MPLSAKPAGAPPTCTRKGVFGVLDLGSSKAVCLVAQGTESGVLRLLGAASIPSRGIRDGAVICLDETEITVRSVVARAEEIAGAQLDGVVVGLNAGSPESIRIDVHWRTRGGKVTPEDISGAIGEAARREVARGRLALHTRPLAYMLDGEPATGEVIGRPCRDLVVRTLLVTATRSSVMNLAAVLDRCDLPIDEMILTPMATALAVTAPEEREAGCVVVDMGSSVTGIGVLRGGAVIHTALLRSGASALTLDLARLLYTPIEGAERLKVVHGGLFATSEDERVFLPYDLIASDDDMARASVPRSRLIGAMRPHLEASLGRVRDVIEALGMPADFAPTVIVTGGVSHTPGIRELARQVLGVNVRLGRPKELLNLSLPLAQTTALSAAFGLLAFASGQGQHSNLIQAQEATTAAEVPRRLLPRLSWSRAA